MNYGLSLLSVPRRIMLVAALLLGAITARAQFSPGELSRLHADLEGMTNCTKCHEIGSEISGAKCLSCHKEIRQAISSGHGYHAATSAQACVACHKEHLGRNARTVLSDQSTFDHRKTGFELSGKHSTLRCDACHRPEYVRNKEVLDMMMERGRTSVLGLDAACSSCHADRHRGTLGTNCGSCHSADGWTPVVRFDHTSTAFPLTAKHAEVPCQKCHPVVSEEKNRVFALGAARFSDCVPCHTSPHRQKLAETCISCHSTTGWLQIQSAAFQHDATGFPLRGAHASVRCEQCHARGSRRDSHSPVRMCRDCHTDYHQGEFAAAYGNDCSVCHTVFQPFSQTTFSLDMHDRSRFSLLGAHRATLCDKCHRPTASNPHSFVFRNLTCNTCHSDPHAGQFSVAGTADCAHCHTSVAWSLPDFDHNSTAFALKGKHASVSCGKCHKTESIGGQTVSRYVGLNSTCEGCHRDPHVGQFAAGINSVCSDCHTPEGWPVLIFDHNRQSTFSLSGGHANVACRQCHPVETIAGTAVIRFKPLEKKCEHCHGGKVPDER